MSPRITACLLTGIDLVALLALGRAWIEHRELSAAPEIPPVACPPVAPVPPCARPPELGPPPLPLAPAPASPLAPGTKPMPGSTGSTQAATAMVEARAKVTRANEVRKRARSITILLTPNG